MELKLTWPAASGFLATRAREVGREEEYSAEEEGSDLVELLRVLDLL